MLRNGYMRVFNIYIYIYIYIYGAGPLIPPLGAHRCTQKYGGKTNDGPGRACLGPGRAGPARGRKGRPTARAGLGRPRPIHFFPEVRSPKNSKSVRLYVISARSTEEKKLPGRARPGPAQAEPGQGRRGQPRVGARLGWAGPGEAFFSRSTEKNN